MKINKILSVVTFIMIFTMGIANAQSAAWIIKGDNNDSYVGAIAILPAAANSVMGTVVTSRSSGPCYWTVSGVYYSSSATYNNAPVWNLTLSNPANGASCGGSSRPMLLIGQPAANAQPGDKGGVEIPYLENTSGYVSTGYMQPMSVTAFNNQEEYWYTADAQESFVYSSIDSSTWPGVIGLITIVANPINTTTGGITTGSLYTRTNGCEFEDNLVTSPGPFYAEDNPLDYIWLWSSWAYNIAGSGCASVIYPNEFWVWADLPDGDPGRVFILNTTDGVTPPGDGVSVTN